MSNTGPGADISSELNRGRGRQIRKSHKKSRNGCQSCKKRRIKCDEQGPPCAACVVRGLDCSLVPDPSLADTRPVSSANTPNPLVQEAGSASGATVYVTPDAHLRESCEIVPSTETFGSHIQELELMHHYTAHTYKNLSVVGLTDETWQVFVPRQALTQACLLHGLLGLAALHLSHTAPDNRAYYLRLMQNYQDRALGEFRDVLDHIGPENCHALMAFSIIAMVYAVATPMALEEDKVIDKMLILLSFLQGVGTVAAAGREWIKDGPFGLFVDMDARIRLDEPREADERLIARLQRINCTSLELVDPSGHAAVALAIDMLERTFRGGDLMVLAWLVMCGPSYVSMLRQEHRVALLVFVHWAISLHRLRRLWWVGDMAITLVTQISPTLENIGPEWQLAVQEVRDRVSGS